jgi:hypothetical protein
MPEPPTRPRYHTPTANLCNGAVGMMAEGVKVRFEAVDIADNALRIFGSKMGSVRPQIDVPMLAE